MLLESVANRYLNVLGFDNRLFNIDARLNPSSGGFNLFIDVDSPIIYRELFDFDTLILSKARELFSCNEVIISIKGDNRSPLRLQVGMLDVLQPNLRSYKLEEPLVALDDSSGDLSQVPEQLRWVAETGYDLDASVWLIDFDGTYRYFQSRKGGVPLQPTSEMIGKKICEQNIPVALKQQTAFNHALAIESRQTVVDSYISPRTGKEIVTKIKPYYQHEICVVFSMPRFFDQLAG